MFPPDANEMSQHSKMSNNVLGRCPECTRREKKDYLHTGFYLHYLLSPQNDGRLSPILKLTGLNRSETPTMKGVDSSSKATDFP